MSCMCTCCVLYYNWQNISIARNAVLLHIHTHGEQKLTVVVELTEEEKEKDEERKRRKALERQRVEDRERELKRLGAERKKEEAVRLRELGVDVSGPKILSKKEKAEIEARKGKGHRTAKTGSRATKYAGPGSKLEKETGKKKKHAASK